MKQESYIIYTDDKENCAILDKLDEIYDENDEENRFWYAHAADGNGNIIEPEQKPELIKGILRLGHKMMIAAPSKAGKSFLAIQLALAIAYGEPWLGLECKRGYVLYLNFELDKPTFQERFIEVKRKMLPDKPETNSIHVINLRGVNISMYALAAWIKSKIEDFYDYDAIILDPLYKLIDGDENSATDMKKICAHIDAIAETTGAAVIYIHHHPKGNQGRKSAQDRASGSGVFLRDIDAEIDLIEVLPDKDHPLPDGASTWRASFTVRNFPFKKPIELLFHYPTHEVVEGLETAKTAYGKEVQAKQEKAQAAKNGKKNSKQQRLVEFIRSYTSETGEPPHIETAIDHFINKKGKHEFSSATLYNWVKEDGAGFTIDNGYLFALESDGKTLDTIKPENIVINGVTKSEPQETA